jgi:hypothetical protein
MGMYDTIHVYQRCPYCGKHQSFDAQTKDLDDAMWNFYSLPDDWFVKKPNSFGSPQRKFRLGLPVFKEFPMDKADKVWKNQAERREASATVPKKYKQLKSVGVIVDCHSAECQAWADKKDIKRQGCPSGFGRMFDGKIKVSKGYLIGEIYDIQLSDKKMPRRKK